MGNHENIIIALCLIGIILTIGFAWTFVMLEEIRHKHVKLFDQLLKVTTVAELGRNELAEEIFECENNPDFHGHSLRGLEYNTTFQVVPITLIERLLIGIDEQQTDSDVGWWETSTGAKAGQLIMKAIRENAFSARAT